MMTNMITGRLASTRDEATFPLFPAVRTLPAVGGRPLTACPPHSRALRFTSDNGGPTNGFEGTASNNYPLKGGKKTIWEGGTRVAGLVSGWGIPGGRKTYEKMYASDCTFPFGLDSHAFGGAALGMDVRVRVHSSCRSYSSYFQMKKRVLSS